MRRVLPFFSALAMTVLLGGCAAAIVGGAAAGSGAVHDRRSVGTVLGDRNLQLSIADAINDDRELAWHNDVSVVVFNGVALLVGTVRSEALRQQAHDLASGFQGTRKLIDMITVGEPEGFWAHRRDNFLTARVKTGLLDIIDLPGFDPTRVNVTTTHRTVYLMGLVSPQEAERVTAVARDVPGVDKVVKVFEYRDGNG